LAALRRTKSGRFDVEGSLTIEALKSSTKSSIASQIISLPDISRMRGA
jgi:tRNA U55 pseudouridine synthase TruB